MDEWVSPYPFNPKEGRVQESSGESTQDQLREFIQTKMHLCHKNYDGQASTTLKQNTGSLLAVALSLRISIRPKGRIQLNHLSVTAASVWFPKYANLLPSKLSAHLPLVHAHLLVSLRVFSSHAYGNSRSF